MRADLLAAEALGISAILLRQRSRRARHLCPPSPMCPLSCRGVTVVTALSLAYRSLLKAWIDCCSSI